MSTVPLMRKEEPIPDRVVVRCPRCNLRQFITENRKCRKCRVFIPLIEVMPKLPPIVKLSNEIAVEHIGKRIYELRVRAGLRQADFSAVTGISRGYISRLENSNMSPSLGMVERIAEALNIEPRLLFMTDPVAEMAGDWLMVEVAKIVHDVPCEKWHDILRIIECIGRSDNGEPN